MSDSAIAYGDCLSRLTHLADVLALDASDTLLGIANTLQATPHDELGNDISQRIWAIRGIGLELDTYAATIYELVDCLKAPRQEPQGAELSAERKDSIACACRKCGKPARWSDAGGKGRITCPTCGTYDYGIG